MGDERSKKNLSKLSIYTKLFVVSCIYLIARAHIKHTSVCLQLPLSEHLVLDLIEADDGKFFRVKQYMLCHAQS